MKLFACAIRDKQVEAFLPVFFVRAKGEAMRHFLDLMSDPQARFSKHGADYELYVLSSYDDGSGEFAALPEGPQRLMSGLDALAALKAE